MFHGFTMVRHFLTHTVRLYGMNQFPLGPSARRVSAITPFRYEVEINAGIGRCSNSGTNLAESREDRTRWREISAKSMAPAIDRYPGFPLRRENTARSARGTNAGCLELVQASRRLENRGSRICEPVTPVPLLHHWRSSRVFRGEHSASRRFEDEAI